MLDIRLFGPLDVRVHGEPVRPLRSRRGGWLLALLALRQDREVERGWLATMLWPESPPDTALANLRRTLLDLRDALGPAKICLCAPSARTLRLDSRAFCDVVVFDACLAAGDPASLEAAIELYRAPLLEGCAEEWATPERESREQQFLEVLEKLASTAIAHREYAVAARYLRRAINIDPLRESAHRVLMEALARAGDYAAVDRHYRELRLLLHKEVNAEPTVETTTLYWRLRQESRLRPAKLPPQTAPLARRRLPCPLTTLVGRVGEIEEAVSAMERHRLVTLTGPGGVGKTRLAIAVAEQIGPGYPNGICFVDLVPVAEAGGVPLAIGRALGIREESNRPVLETVCEYVAGRHLLLILDNCEHLVEACAGFVQSVLEAAPRLRMLTTSRRPLGVPGEHILRIPPLGLPEFNTKYGKDSLELVMASDAARLFVQRACEANPGFRLAPAQASAIGEICRLLDGMPLALELAAAGIRSVPLSEIVARLRNSLEAGLVEVRTRDDRHRSLHAALDWSCRLLRPEEMRFLCRLSVFAAGFSLEAASFVGGDAAQPPGDTLPLLARLIDHSLIVQEPDLSEERYRLLETTRQYLLAKLAECGEETATRQRHLAFYLAYAKRTEPELTGPEQAILLKRLEHEHSNLCTALDFSRTSPEHAIQGLCMASALWRFWAYHGHLSEGRKYLQEFLEGAGDEANPSLRARALLGGGNLALLQGDYTSAEIQFQEAEEIARSAGESAILASALQGLGNTAHEENRNEEARRFQEQSLALWQELGDECAVANVLNNLGNIAKELRQLDRATELYHHALALHRKTGNFQGAATTTLCLGIVAAYSGNLQEAVRLCEESLQAYRVLGERRGMVYACTNLAAALHDLGRQTEAALVLEEAMDIAHDLGHRTLLAECLDLKARFAREVGDHDTARDSLREALALVRPSTDPRIQTWCLLHAALAAADWGCHEGFAVLWGTLQHLPETRFWQPDEHPPPGMPNAELRVRAVLGEDSFRVAANRGSCMSRREAIEYALALLNAG